METEKKAMDFSKKAWDLRKICDTLGSSSGNRSRALVRSEGRKMRKIKEQHICGLPIIGKIMKFWTLLTERN